MIGVSGAVVPVRSVRPLGDDGRRPRLCDQYPSEAVDFEAVKTSQFVTSDVVKEGDEIGLPDGSYAVVSEGGGYGVMGVRVSAGVVAGVNSMCANVNGETCGSFCPYRVAGEVTVGLRSQVAS